MIAIGADHGGFKLKEEIKKYLDEKEIKYKDFGTYNEERTDYPIYAEKVAKAVQSKECDSGILICKSGAGMAMVANKFKGIRAGVGYTENLTKALKSDDDINVLCFGSEYMTVSQAVASVRVWIGTNFNGGRYEDRVQMIKNIEENEMK